MIREVYRVCAAREHRGGIGALPIPTRFLAEDDATILNPFFQTIANAAIHIVTANRNGVALSAIPGIARVAVRMAGSCVFWAGERLWIDTSLSGRSGATGGHEWPDPTKEIM